MSHQGLSVSSVSNRLLNQEMSIEKGLRVVIPRHLCRGVYSFRHSVCIMGKQCLWTIYFRVICLDCWKDHICTLDSDERSLPFGLLVLSSIVIPCDDCLLTCIFPPGGLRSLIVTLPGGSFIVFFLYTIIGLYWQIIITFLNYSLPSGNV